MAYMRLGDLLIAAGAITQEQLEEALTIQKQTKERLGDVLIENNIITERQLIEALQMQLGVDFIDLTAISIPLELAKFVPRAIAKIGAPPELYRLVNAATMETMGKIRPTPVSASVLPSGRWPRKTRSTML